MNQVPNERSDKKKKKETGPSKTDKFRRAGKMVGAAAALGGKGGDKEKSPPPGDKDKGSPKASKRASRLQVDKVTKGVPTIN